MDLTTVKKGNQGSRESAVKYNSWRGKLRQRDRGRIGGCNRNITGIWSIGNMYDKSTGIDYRQETLVSYLLFRTHLGG